MASRRPFLIAVALFGLFATSCGGDGAADTATADASTTQADTTGASVGSGIGSVSADEAAALLANAPDDLVVLDVRTPEEFAEGHIDGAILVDFYDPDFADQLAALDPSVPYVVYCRSGNRSGETMTLLDDLGFESAVDVDGGIVAWSAAGLPTTTD